MSINAFGTDAFLRTQIENKLKAIAADDRMINFRINWRITLTINIYVKLPIIPLLEHSCL
jgi:hypothetical protein